MADTKISNMPSGTTIMGPELIPGVQGGSNVKFTAAQIMAYVVGELAPVAITNDYNDLDNLPDLAPVATSGLYSDLTGTPTLAPVATSGLYSDLTGTPTIPAGANPSATAGPSAVNGVATTFMRSDAAPAVQQGSASQKGIVQVDGTTITASSGIISAALPSVPSSANPTATAGPTAINGSAGTWMRSDAAPAVQQGSNSQKGIVQVDGTTITASSGVISAVQQTLPTGANPTATAGATAVNGVATTFMRSDGAPAIAQGSSSVKGIVQVDGTTITATGGVISAVGGGGPSAANPTATASDVAVNGVATTFMRSDAAPAVQKASAAQFGVVQVDGTTITATGGVISASGGGGGGASPKAALIYLASSTGTFNPSIADQRVNLDTLDFQDTMPASDGGPAYKFWYGADKTITAQSGNTLTIGTHGFTTGDGPFYLTGSGTMPTGTNTTTKYWAIVMSSTTIQLATSRANALAGTAVTITGAGSGTRLVGTGSQLVVPVGVSRIRLSGQTTLGNVTPNFTTPNQCNFYSYITKNLSLTAPGTTQQNAVPGGGAPGMSFTTPILAVTGGDIFIQMFGFGGDTSVSVTATGLTWFSMEATNF